MLDPNEPDTPTQETTTEQPSASRRSAVGERRADQLDRRLQRLMHPRSSASSSPRSRQRGFPPRLRSRLRSRRAQRSQRPSAPPRNRCGDYVGRQGREDSAQENGQDGRPRRAKLLRRGSSPFRRDRGAGSSGRGCPNPEPLTLQTDEAPDAALEPEPESAPDQPTPDKPAPEEAALEEPAAPEAAVEEAARPEEPAVVEAAPPEEGAPEGVEDTAAEAEIGEGRRRRRRRGGRRRRRTTTDETGLDETALDEAEQAEEDEAVEVNGGADLTTEGARPSPSSPPPTRRGRGGARRPDGYRSSGT